MGLIIKGPPSQGFSHHFPYDLNSKTERFGLDDLPWKRGVSPYFQVNQLLIFGSNYFTIFSNKGFFMGLVCLYLYMKTIKKNQPFIDMV